MTPETSSSPIAPLETASLEEVRAELCGILDELANARADRAVALRAQFDVLWRRLPEPGEEPTLH